MYVEAGQAKHLDATGLTALVVDDEPVNRMVLSAMLRSLGFRIDEATNGVQACAYCSAQTPDIIFMDIMMPQMDGFEATQRIKQQLGEVFVPVIFLTAITDEAQLRQSIEVGGDDFMTKPYSRVLLHAKIDAALRIRGMHRALAAQRDELQEYRARHQRDMEVARRILEHISTRADLDVANVRYQLRPMEILNGDIILAGRRPSGEQCFLLGDFTGHGLPAAIGAQTAHDVFISMVTKGFNIDDTVRELNRKMMELLPVDRFLSAAVIELDNETGQLRVWNGGLPDILVRSIEDGQITRFRSTNLPLGIAAMDENSGRALATVLNPGDFVLLCSDGLVEAHDPQAELFGSERLARAFSVGTTLDECRDGVLAALAAHVATAPPSDDVALLLLECVPEFAASAPDGEAEQVGKPPGNWQFSTRLDAAELRRADPIATVIQVMDVAQGLGPLRSPLFVILNELFSNALEHGLLGLDSGIKAGEHGFAAYYELRAARLEKLEEASIDIDCRHEADGNGGRLHIRVRQSGAGFDPGALAPEPAGARQLRGRGVQLVRSLAESLDYSDGGRIAEAVYRWRVPTPG